MTQYTCMYVYVHKTEIKFHKTILTLIADILYFLLYSISLKNNSGLGPLYWFHDLQMGWQLQLEKPCYRPPFSTGPGFQALIDPSPTTLHPPESRNKWTLGWATNTTAQWGAETLYPSISSSDQVKSGDSQRHTKGPSSLTQTSTSSPIWHHNPTPPTFPIPFHCLLLILFSKAHTNL